jgi:hypothetical protein
MHQGGGYLNYNGSIDIARTMEELRVLRKGDKPEITIILSLRTLRNHGYNIHLSFSIVRANHINTQT